MPQLSSFTFEWHDKTSGIWPTRHFHRRWDPRVSTQKWEKASSGHQRDSNVLRSPSTHTSKYKEDAAAAANNLLYQSMCVVYTFRTQEHLSGTLYTHL